MGKRNLDIGVIEENLNNMLNEIEDKIVQGLCKVGESALKRMVKTSLKGGRDYQDQTGNLRSSCGFAIAKDGEILTTSGFEGDGQQGAMVGKDLATRIAITESTNRFSLVLVAGMEYATYVQKMGYDVAETGELEAIKRASELTEFITQEYGN